MSHVLEMLVLQGGQLGNETTLPGLWKARLVMSDCCLECDRPADRRGLCAGHYQAAWRRVKAGVVGWSDLEEAGLCLPSQRRSSDFGRKLDRLVEEMRS